MTGAKMEGALVWAPKIGAPGSRNGAQGLVANVAGTLYSIISSTAAAVHQGLWGIGSMMYLYGGSLGTLGAIDQLWACDISTTNWTLLSGSFVTPSGVTYPSTAGLTDANIGTPGARTQFGMVHNSDHHHHAWQRHPRARWSKCFY